MAKHLNDYQNLFELSGLPYFGNDTLLKNYAIFGVLFTFDGKVWKSYFPKKSLEKTLEEGIEFYGNEQVFNDYEISFEKYKKDAGELLDQLVTQSELSSEDIEKFLQAIIAIHTHYIKTEFFYSDKAFALAETNLIIKNNLARLGEIKNPGREFINKIFFGNDGYIARIFSIIGKQFVIDVDDLYFYSHEELKGLWSNKKVEDKDIIDRKIAYVSDCDGGKIKNMFGKEALTFIEAITVPLEVKTEFKGIIANKGKIQARATVLNVGSDNFDEIASEIEAMRKGDILVAQTTSPELTQACYKASGIITNEGGMMSHAAIIARELHIPCVVAVHGATDYIQTGDNIELDADQGMIRILKKGTQ